MNQELFKQIILDENHHLFLGELPQEFTFNHEQFQDFWNLHPEAYHTIMIRGKEIPTPRWQQAYGKNYSYTGSKNNALPISEELSPFLEWSQENIHSDLNGLLLNWYEGQRKHYIGAHRDDTRELVKGSPIVTISLGEERIFRMRPYGQKGYRDVVISQGSVLIIPWETNLIWTHEVPHFAKYQGRRISITLRVFKD